jgi:primosomal protein N' (replication factor Y) (superfamily II helicase)
MFIQVKLLKGFKEPLLYATYPEWDNQIKIGSLIRVPLRTKNVLAYVERIFQHKPATTFELKYASHIEKIPDDTHYFKYVSKLAYYYQTDPHHFLKRLHLFLMQDEPAEVPFVSYESEELSHTDTVTLTPEQQTVVSYLTNSLKNPTYTPTLLHGVTGSGKTEVYKKLILQTIHTNKTAVLLLPEVTLAVQFMHLLKSYFNETLSIFSFHSATSPKEKKQLWSALLAGNPLLIIGVHLPLLLPIQNLGLIIIDEEHDNGYQEKKHPKINSKEAALMRAQIANIPILLGSATPSITSLYNVKHKKWYFFQLKDRFKGIFPTIKIVPLLDKKQRKNFWISKDLEQAIAHQLQKKEQTLVFLNRRGFSFFVQCKSCSFIFYCSSCSVSLTLHEHNDLICHYCGYSRQLPLVCTCGSKEFLKKGIGTQHIVQILQKLFPRATIARADLDVTVDKKVWSKTVNEFQEGTLDILVGTQTITKGYHFPKVSLVGIIWADLNLHFPMYNAVETTIQQLIQVAGRAGRSGLKSTVIVQTMAQHDSFSYLNELDYIKFYANEFENRSLVEYPPCIRLVEIELKHDDEHLLEQESSALAHFLTTTIQQKKMNINVLGPAKPPVSKLKNWHIRKIYLKSSSIDAIIQLYKFINKNNFSSFIFFTPNPLN